MNHFHFQYLPNTKVVVIDEDSEYFNQEFLVASPAGEDEVMLFPFGETVGEIIVFNYQQINKVSE
jgi:hypothetical protein